MSQRYQYVTSFPDGSQVRVEETIDDNGDRVAFKASTRRAPEHTWGPPRQLAEQP